MPFQCYRDILKVLSVCYAMAAVFLMPGPARAVTDTLWYENFEGSDWNNDWHASNGTWEAGIPTSGPMAAHKDSGCAATYLAGNYPADVETVPDLSI